jgi:CheY-like chemotaxis protein
MATVLCVSHEWNLNLDTVRALTDAGHSLLTAGNAYDAICKLTAQPVDAVIVNRRLPDLDVRAFVAYVKAHVPEMPVIMVTARMPLPGEKPEFVDAVIGKSHCVDLLVPTLEVLGSASGVQEMTHTSLAPSDSGERKAA